MPKFSEHSKSIIKVFGGYYCFLGSVLVGMSLGSKLAARYI